MRPARIAEANRDVMPMTISSPGRQSVPGRACLPPAGALRQPRQARPSGIPGATAATGSGFRLRLSVARVLPLAARQALRRARGDQR